VSGVALFGPGDTLPQVLGEPVGVLDAARVADLFVMAPAGLEQHCEPIFYQQVFGHDFVFPIAADRMVDQHHGGGRLAVLRR